MSDSGLRQQNEGLLKLVQTMEEYSRELEVRESANRPSVTPRWLLVTVSRNGRHAWPARNRRKTKLAPQKRLTRYVIAMRDFFPGSYLSSLHLLAGFRASPASFRHSSHCIVREFILCMPGVSCCTDQPLVFRRSPGSKVISLALSFPSSAFS